jgi:hypothetical protein
MDTFQNTQRACPPFIECMRLRHYHRAHSCRFLPLCPPRRRSPVSMISLSRPTIDHLQPKLCAARRAVVLQHMNCPPGPARVDRCTAAVHPPIALVAANRKALVIYNHTAHRAANLARHRHVTDQRFYDACNFFSACQRFPVFLPGQALDLVHHPLRRTLNFTLLACARNLLLLVGRAGQD